MAKVQIVGAVLVVAFGGASILMLLLAAMDRWGGSDAEAPGLTSAASKTLVSRSAGSAGAGIQRARRRDSDVFSRADQVTAAERMRSIRQR